MPTANNLDFKLEKQTSKLDAVNNTVECFFDISGSGLQLANQYIAFGDGKFENKNEKIVVNDLSNVTISLKAGQNHFLKLVQKYGSPQRTYYSPLTVYAMAQPSIGTFRNVIPLDKAFRVDICYNQLDLDQFDGTANSAIQKVTFLVSYMNESNGTGDIFEIEKNVSLANNAMQTRYYLSNHDISNAYGPNWTTDISGFDNSLTYDINFFLTNRMGDGELSEPFDQNTQSNTDATPLELPDQSTIAILSNTALDYSGQMHLTIGAPDDIIVYSNDLSAVHLRATHADWSNNIYKVLDISNYPQIGGDGSGNFDFSYNWVDASFGIGMDISFASSYENNNGRATTGDDEIYASKARWSADVLGTTFIGPGPVNFGTTTLGDDGTSMTFNWTDSSANNGSVVPTDNASNKYKVQLYEISGNQYDKDASNVYVPSGDELQQDQNSAPFTGLDAGKFYKVGVKQVNRNPNDTSLLVEGEFFMSARRKPGKAPSIINKPTLTQSANQITVSWVKPNMNGYAFVQYDIELYSGGDFDTLDASAQIIANGTNTEDSVSQSFTGLTNGTLYKAHVKATNALDREIDASGNIVRNGTSGFFSDKSDALAPVDALGAPTDVYAIIDGTTEGNMSYRDIKIYWKAPTSLGGNTVVSYDISFSEDGSLNDVVLTNPHTDLSVNIVDGTPNHADLSMVDGPYDGSNNEYLYVIDLSGQTAEDEFTNIQVRVNASNPNGGITSSSYATAKVINTTTNVIEMGAADFSHEVYKHPGQVSTPTVQTNHVPSSDSNRGSVHVSWVAPASNGRTITYYVVSYKKQGESNFLTYTTSSGDVRTANIDVSNNVEYEFKVKAANSAGFGLDSAIAKFTNTIQPQTPTDADFDIEIDADAGTVTFTIKGSYSDDSNLTGKMVEVYDENDTMLTPTVLLIATTAGSTQDISGTVSSPNASGKSYYFKINGRDPTDPTDWKISNKSPSKAAMNFEVTSQYNSSTDAKRGLVKYEYANTATGYNNNLNKTDEYSVPNNTPTLHTLVSTNASNLSKVTTKLNHTNVVPPQKPDAEDFDIEIDADANADTNEDEVVDEHNVTFVIKNSYEDDSRLTKTYYELFNGSTSLGESAFNASGASITTRVDDISTAVANLKFVVKSDDGQTSLASPVKQSMKFAIASNYNSDDDSNRGEVKYTYESPTDYTHDYNNNEIVDVSNNREVEHILVSTLQAGGKVTTTRKFTNPVPPKKPLDQHFSIQVDQESGLVTYDISQAAYTAYDDSNLTLDEIMLLSSKTGSESYTSSTANYTDTSFTKTITDIASYVYDFAFKVQASNGTAGKQLSVMSDVKSSLKPVVDTSGLARGQANITWNNDGDDFIARNHLLAIYDSAGTELYNSGPLADDINSHTNPISSLLPLNTDFYYSLVATSWNNTTINTLTAPTSIVLPPIKPLTTQFVLTAGDGSIQVNIPDINFSFDDSNLSITDVKIQYKKTLDLVWIQGDPISKAANGLYDISELDNGFEYEVQVALVANGNNSGDYSESNTAMPRGQTPLIKSVQLIGKTITVGVDAEGNNLIGAELQLTIGPIDAGVYGIVWRTPAKKTITLVPSDFLNQNVREITFAYDDTELPGDAPESLQYSITVDSTTSGDDFVSTIGAGADAGDYQYLVPNAKHYY